METFAFEKSITVCRRKHQARRMAKVVTVGILDSELMSTYDYLSITKFKLNIW